MKTVKQPAISTKVEINREIKEEIIDRCTPSDSPRPPIHTPLSEISSTQVSITSRPESLPTIAQARNIPHSHIWNPLPQAPHTILSITKEVIDPANENPVPAISVVIKQEIKQEVTELADSPQIPVSV